MNAKTMPHMHQEVLKTFYCLSNETFWREQILSNLSEERGDGIGIYYGGGGWEKCKGWDWLDGDLSGLRFQNCASVRGKEHLGPTPSCQLWCKGKGKGVGPEG